MGELMPRHLARAVLEAAHHYMAGGPVAGRNEQMTQTPTGQVTNPGPAAPPQQARPGGVPAPGAGAAQNPSGITNGTSNQTNLVQGGVPIQSGWSASAPLSEQTFNSPYASMILNQANGNGPNMGQMQLQSATDQNIANAMALGQSMPGQSNMAAARNILDNQAKIQQQAAGQSAQLDAQQQLAAEQLGSGLTTDEQKLALQQAQGNQGAVQQANALNEDIAKANLGTAQNWQNTLVNAAGGVASGAASGIGNMASGQNWNGSPSTQSPPAQQATSGPTTAPQALPDTSDAGDSEPTDYTEAHGGMIPFPRHYDEGGAVAPSSPAGPDLYSNPDSVNPQTGMSANKLAMSGVLSSASAAPTVGLKPLQQQGSSPILSVFNSIAKSLPYVGQMFSAGEALGKAVDPNSKVWKAEGAARGGEIASILDGYADAGGKVPGRAKTSGDADENDTVRAVLSPGEVVLPRSVTQSDDSPEMAAEFMNAVRKSKAPKPSFSDLLRSHRELSGRLAHLEKLCSGGYA
jgi:hypothetical protein